MFSNACKKKQTIYKHMSGPCGLASAPVRGNLRSFTEHISSESRMGLQYEESQQEMCMKSIQNEAGDIFLPVSFDWTSLNSTSASAEHKIQKEM